ncbi:MAG: DNA methyltransferase [archaeon]
MIFELNKDNIDLARAEVEQLAQIKGKIYENLLLLDKEFDYTRLSYTKNIYKFLFQCKKTEIKAKFQNFDWKNEYKNNFCIRSNETKYEKSFAKFIWEQVDNPKVKLNNSDTEINIFITKNQVIVGKHIHKREEKFHLRRPDIRPGFFPVSLKPKLARALVNLTGVQEGIVWDPFCGTGGILIEAGLMKLTIIGTDIDKKLIELAEKNFKEYKVEGKLEIADARKAKYKADAIVTDPPYGRRASLHKTEIEKLYKEFLKNVYPFIDRVVLMSPNNVEIETEYNKELIATDYVHGTLTRRIFLLKK